MAATVSYSMIMNTQETLTVGVDGASSPVVRHSAYDVTGLLTGTSSPPAATPVFSSVALVAGAATVDLTNMIGAGGGVRDATGQKVQLLRLENPATNANSMTFATGASNGYALWTSWSITLAPGQSIMLFGNDATPDVSATAKTIDVSGTGTQAFHLSVITG